MTLRVQQGKMVPIRMLVNTLSPPGAPFLCCSLDTGQKASDRGKTIVHYAILVLIPLVSEDWEELSHSLHRFPQVQIPQALSLCQKYKRRKANLVNTGLELATLQGLRTRALNMSNTSVLLFFLLPSSSWIEACETPITITHTHYACLLESEGCEGVLPRLAALPQHPKLSPHFWVKATFYFSTWNRWWDGQVGSSKGCQMTVQLCYILWCGKWPWKEKLIHSNKTQPCSLENKPKCPGPCQQIFKKMSDFYFTYAPNFLP